MDIGFYIFSFLGGLLNTILMIIVVTVGML